MFWFRFFFVKTRTNGHRPSDFGRLADGERQRRFGLRFALRRIPEIQRMATNEGKPKKKEDERLNEWMDE